MKFLWRLYKFSKIAKYAYTHRKNLSFRDLEKILKVLALLKFTKKK